MQEVITILVFCAFAVLYLGERLKWNHFAAFACVIGAVFFICLETKDATSTLSPVSAAQAHSPEQP